MINYLPRLQALHIIYGTVNGTTANTSTLGLLAAIVKTCARQRVQSNMLAVKRPQIPISSTAMLFSASCSVTNKQPLSFTHYQNNLDQSNSGVLFLKG